MGTGTLYLVPTPIGRLEDISLRALHLLKQVDRIAAEDPRITRKLLERFEIDASLHRLGSEGAERSELLARLHSGEQIALVCDAGTPGIADPGAEMVRAAVREKIRVVALPGPVAALVALIVSGLPTQRFAFDGFPPRSRYDRHAFFAALAEETRTLLLYETAAYLHSTLQALRAHLGEDREVAVARNLTTPRETIWRGTLAEATQEFRGRCSRSQYTLVIAGTKT